MRDGHHAKPADATGAPQDPVPPHKRPNRVFLSVLSVVVIAVCVLALRDSSAEPGLRTVLGWAAASFFVLNLIGMWVPVVGNALFRMTRR